MSITRGPGRPCFFRGKDRKHPVNAYMTPVGKQALKEARTRMAALVGWDADALSDGDVAEAVLIGWPATLAYRRKHYPRHARPYLKAAGVIP